MILEVNFEEPEMKAALLTLVQRIYPTAGSIDDVKTFTQRKQDNRRAVYHRPSKLL